MDKISLTTIAVTALITIVAKELYAWVLSIAKMQIAKETTKAAARKVFSKRNLLIVWDICLVSGSIFFLVGWLRMTTPITRLDVALIPAFIIASLVSLCLLAYHFGRYF
jgi:hypothetical protein